MKPPVTVSEASRVEVDHTYTIEGFVHSRSGVDFSSTEIIVSSFRQLSTNISSALKGDDIPEAQFPTFPIKDQVTGYFSASLKGQPGHAYYVFAISRDRRNFSSAHLFRLPKQNRAIKLELNIEERELYQGRVVDPHGVGIPDAIVLTSSKFLYLDNHSRIQRLLYGFMSREKRMGLVPISIGGQGRANILTVKESLKRDHVFPLPRVQQIPFPLVNLLVTGAGGRFQLPTVLQSSQVNQIHVFAKGYTTFSGTISRDSDIVLHRTRDVTVQVIDRAGTPLKGTSISLGQKREFEDQTFHGLGLAPQSVPIFIPQELTDTDLQLVEGVVVIRPSSYPGVCGEQGVSNTKGLYTFQNIAIKEGWVHVASEDHGIASTQFHVQDKSLTIQLSGVGALEIKYDIPQDLVDKLRFKAHPASMENLKYRWKAGDTLASTLPAGPLVLTYTLGPFSKTLKLNIKANSTETITIREYTQKH
ncbi:MAG: hypothetical protein P1V97_25110 [Planctomycetota bacterium]|nr:hypothetical protein [Planctomycetota bacterium]